MQDEAIEASLLTVTLRIMRMVRDGAGWAGKVEA